MFQPSYVFFNVFGLKLDSTINCQENLINQKEGDFELVLNFLTSFNEIL